jgi:hypothetical protein
MAAKFLEGDRMMRYPEGAWPAVIRSAWTTKTGNSCSEHMHSSLVQWRAAAARRRCSAILQPRDPAWALRAFPPASGLPHVCHQAPDPMLCRIPRGNRRACQPDAWLLRHEPVPFRRVGHRHNLIAGLIQEIVAVRRPHRRRAAVVGDLLPSTGVGEGLHANRTLSKGCFSSTDVVFGIHTIHFA